MTRTPHSPSTLVREDGFTLIELLVAMLMSTIVLLGILNTLDMFSVNASRQTRVSDANDQVRKAMDRIVSDLRQAATIQVAESDDLLYTVAESATVTRSERICLDTSNRLWRTSTTTAQNASAITGGGQCPLPSSGGVKITPLAAANTASNPLFRYDSAAAASVRSVGITVALNAGNGGRTDVSTLRASTFVRAKSETAAPVTGANISTACNSSSAVPTLTLSSTVGSATVKYTDTEGNVLGSGSAGSAVTLSSATPTATTVIAYVTTSTGLISQLVKTLECTT
jgi:prepilin-type N-terminal cleavage/methylation domain-containing protein